MAETVVWIAADGTETTLEVEWKASGRFAPPTRFEEEGVPESPGMRLRRVEHGAREFVLPLWITGTSESDLRTRLRALVRAMNPTSGDGRVRVTSPVGDQREIVCRYADGLDLTEALGDTSGPLLERATVLFRAHDPYWRDVSDVTATYTIGTPSSFFPFFPMRLTSSSVFTDAAPVNGGDVEAWPVWTITGPGSAIYLRNLSTGYVLNLGTSLGSGETATIDTRPGAKTVLKNDGTSLWPYVSASSYLWPLQPGANSLRIEMSSATAASSVRLAYRPRYLSP